MMDQIDKFNRLDKEKYFTIIKKKDVILHKMIMEKVLKDIGKNLKIQEINTFNFLE